MTPVSVLIVDDHEVVRIGLSSLLKRQPQFRLLGEAANGTDAIAKVDRLRPQVVLMDVRLPGVTGVEACREILDRWPDTRVIMLTSFADKSAAMGSILAGAAGYMLKQVTGDELIRGIETVARGGNLIDPMLAKEIFAQMRTMAHRRTEAELTDQEHNVLNLISEGMSNREIATALYLSEKTVRNYVSNVLQKLGMSNRSQAAVYAAKKKLGTSAGLD